MLDHEVGESADVLLQKIPLRHPGRPCLISPICAHLYLGSGLWYSITPLIKAISDTTFHSFRVNVQSVLRIAWTPTTTEQTNSAAILLGVRYHHSLTSATVQNHSSLSIISARWRIRARCQESWVITAWSTRTFSCRSSALPQTLTQASNLDSRVAEAERVLKCNRVLMGRATISGFTLYPFLLIIAPQHIPVADTIIPTEYKLLKISQLKSVRH